MKVTDELSVRLYTDLLALCDSYRDELTAHQFAQLVTEFCRADASGEVTATAPGRPPNVICLSSRRPRHDPDDSPPRDAA